MHMAAQVQILEKAACISNRTNSHGKGMNPNILPPAMGKIVEQTGFFNLGLATNLGEGKLWIQTCYLHLKIDFVLHPACAEGSVITYDFLVNSLQVTLFF